LAQALPRSRELRGAPNEALSSPLRPPMGRLSRDPSRLAAAVALALLTAARAHAAASGGGGAQQVESSGRLGFMRARARSRTRAQERLQLLTQQAPVLTTPIPKFGLANVTMPTAVPPNMMLDPWADAQPADTAVGAFLTSSMQDAPTATPPPSQAALDIMAGGCPVLDQWPARLEISAPMPCHTAYSGRWASPPSATAGGVGSDIMAWSQSCNLLAGGLSPMISYSMPGGDAFATSSTAITLVGNKIEVYDCGGILRYTLEEKVYHERGSVDQTACMKYKSCDGTVWVQYFLRNKYNQLVAHTGYLNIFQSDFQIMDAAGMTLATARRKGDWSPDSPHCGGHRIWELIHSSPMPPGAFENPTQQWPLAVMVTIAAVRDSSRRPSGLVAPSWCEISKTGLFISFLFLLSAIVAGGVVLFIKIGRGPLRDMCVDVEARLCPKRMRKASKYEGH